MLAESWSSMPLGQVVTLQRGFDLPYRLRRSGSIPIVTSSGITDTHDTAQVQGPGVVTGRYGTIGEVFFVSTDFWPHNTTLYVRDFKGNDPLFVSYLLRMIDFASHSGKSGVPGVNRNDLHQLRVRVPLRNEQRAIATALSKVDALIGALDKLIAKKRSIKLAATQQLLTGKTRLPAFKTNAGCKDTPIGVIPEQWDPKACEELCLKIQDGTHFSPKLGGNEYLYVTSRNIGSGVLDVTDAERIDGPQHRKIYARCDTRKGDLLLTKDGANTGNATINSLDEECSLLSSVAFLRFDPSLHDPRFYLQYILSARGQSRIKDLMSGNAITRLTLAKIRRFLLPVPKIEEQRAIASVLSDMDAEIAALERRRDKTTAIKQGMMQALLTGRIRLVKPGAKA